MALKSDGFVEVDYPTLESVLLRETLNCKEYVVFEAAMNWAGAECVRRDMEPTSANKRNVLGPALYHIRVPTMSLEEYANGAAQSGILTLEESNDVFLYFTAVNKPDIQFDCHPRAGLKSQVRLMDKDSVYNFCKLAVLIFSLHIYHRCAIVSSPVHIGATSGDTVAVVTVFNFLLTSASLLLGLVCMALPMGQQSTV